MALTLGTTPLNKIYLGSTAINKAYLGATVVFSGGSFDPASLFAGGQEGAWYDPSDLDTLFQDSAGTTPVTASGQPVGKMLDKSGNGNHATQAIYAKRPIYTEGSGLAWLAFDGVGDAMEAPALGVTSSALTMLYSATQSGGSADDVIFGVENTTSNRFQNFTTSSGARVTGVQSSGGSTFPAYGNVSTNQIAGAVWNGSAVQNYINGAASGANSSLSGSMDLTSGVIYIGKSPSFSVVFSGIFRGGLLINRGLSAEEVISFSTYLAAKSGVTL
jgi:hypothetical protein